MIEVKNLTKIYGNFVAIKDVSFKATKGEILGFLGPNGAGKTTTMRIISGFMPATAGTVLVDELDIFTQSLEARRKIGYLPENPPLYNEMRVEAYLRFAGKLRGVTRANLEGALEHVIEVCGLKAVSTRICGQLSKGYRQRVGLAGSIIHDPPVVILDEPTIGLDPRQIRDIRALIRDLGGPGRHPHHRAVDPYPARGVADLRQGGNHQRGPRGTGGKPRQASGGNVARRRLPKRDRARARPSRRGSRRRA